MQLADGRVTLRGGGETDEISAGAENQVRAGSVIDGGAGGDILRLSNRDRSGAYIYDPVTQILHLRAAGRTDTVYDLTAIGLSRGRDSRHHRLYGSFIGTTTW